MRRAMGLGRSTSIKKCETGVGCGGQLFAKRNEKKRCCSGNFGDPQKKDPKRPLSMLESKKLRDIQAGPRFRMVKKRQAVPSDVHNLASDTRGERWATIPRNHVWDGEAFVQAQNISICSRGAKK